MGSPRQQTLSSAQMELKSVRIQLGEVPCATEGLTERLYLDLDIFRLVLSPL